MNRLKQVLFLILLFSLPLFIFPWGPSFFEVPKVILSESLIILIFLFSLLNSNLGFRNYPKTFLVPIAGLFILSLFDLIFFHQSTTLFGNQFRLQGTFLLWNLLLLAVLSFQIDSKKIPWGWPVVSLICLLLTIVIFGQQLNNRSIGSLGEPNALAATVIFFWPWVFAKFYKLKGWRFLKLVVPMLAILIIISSGSRSGVIAFFIQIFFLLSLRNFNFSLKKATLLGIVLLCFSLILPFWERGGIWENRWQVWQTSLVAGVGSPIFGHGFGNAELAIHWASVILKNHIQYLYVDSSHNFLIDYLVQGGLIGLGLLLFLLSFTLKRFIKDKKELEISLMLGLLTVMLFNPTSVVTLVAFWFLIGQAISK